MLGNQATCAAVGNDRSMLVEYHIGLNEECDALNNFVSCEGFVNAILNVFAGSEKRRSDRDNGKHSRGDGPSG